MADAVLERFDMTVEHRAVGADPELVGRTVHVQPFLGGELAIGDRRPHRLTEHFGPAARQRIQPGVAQRPQHVGDRHLIDPGDVRELHRRESLDVHVRILRFERPEHLHVVREPRLHIESAHDVELAGHAIVGGAGFLEDLLERVMVRPLFLREPSERAEDARLPEHADVRGVDVLIRGERHAVAVRAPVGRIGHQPDAEQVRTAKEGDAVGVPQSLACFHLVGDRQ